LRRWGACAVLATLYACSPPQASRLSSPAPSPVRSVASEAATPLPVHIETNGSGDRYITVVQRVKESANRTRIAYRLRALSSQADIVGSESTVSFAQPHLTFFDQQGKELIADSPQAKITQHDKSVLMSGGVHARTDDGSVLTCDTLRYDGRTEKLHGEGHVVLAGPNDLTLTGNYLEGDIRLDDVRIAARPI
jgi:hypothetical protein